MSANPVSVTCMGVGQNFADMYAKNMSFVLTPSLTHSFIFMDGCNLGKPPKKVVLVTGLHAEVGLREKIPLH